MLSTAYMNRVNDPRKVIQMAQPAYSLSIRDWDKKIGNTQILTGAVTAVSLPGLLTQIGAMRTAIDGLTIGVLADEKQTVFNTILSQAKPTSEFAQRGNKWLVSYHDNTAFFDDPVNAIPNEGYLKPFSVEIPCADNSLLDDNETFLPLSQTQAAAFVTAFQAMGRSPYGGVVVVDSIEQVNRSV